MRRSAPRAFGPLKKTKMGSVQQPLFSEASPPLCHPACPGVPGEQSTCLRQVKGGMNMGKAVFAIQAGRAGTKHQPSPEGLGP